VTYKSGLPVGFAPVAEQLAVETPSVTVSVYVPTLEMPVVKLVNVPENAPDQVYGPPVPPLAVNVVVNTGTPVAGDAEQLRAGPAPLTATVAGEPAHATVLTPFVQLMP